MRLGSIALALVCAFACSQRALNAEEVAERAIMVIYEEDQEQDKALASAAQSGLQVQAFSQSSDVRRSAKEEIHSLLASAFEKDKDASDPGGAVQMAIASAAAADNATMQSIPWFGAEVVQSTAASIAAVKNELDKTEAVKTKKVRYVEFARVQYLTPEFDAVPASIVPATSSANAKWGVAKIKADQVWSRSTGKGVRVAIVDSGLDHRHPFFRADLIDMKPENNLVRPGSLPVDDQFVQNVGGGHGTHVAGIIGGQNGYGVAPDATLIPIKVFDNQGQTLAPNFFISIDRAIKSGADVVNMSFMGPRFEGNVDMLRLWNESIQKAMDNNVTVVVASGNRTPFANSFLDIGVPGGCPDTITVAATTSTDSVANGSLPTSANGSSTFPSKPDIAAPGGNWFNVAVEGVPSALAYSQGEISFPGTSMAAPHVTGVVALLKEDFKLTPKEVKDLLKKTAVPPKNNRTGSGRVDALAAYNLLDPGGNGNGGNNLGDSDAKELREILSVLKKINKTQPDGEDATPEVRDPAETLQSTLKLQTKILNEQLIFMMRSSLEELRDKQAERDEAFNKLSSRHEDLRKHRDIAKAERDAKDLAAKNATDALKSADTASVEMARNMWKQALVDMEVAEKTWNEKADAAKKLDSEMTDIDKDMKERKTRIEKLEEELKKREQM